MIKLMKHIELPHVSTYKHRWLRRVMIVLTTPQEIVRAVYHTFVGAKYWWVQP